MASFVGRYPANTFQGLLNVDNNMNGVDSTLRSVQDGLGHTIPMQVSTSTVNFTNLQFNAQNISIGGPLSTTGAVTINGVFSTNGAVALGGTVTTAGAVGIGGTFTTTGTFSIAGNFTTSGAFPVTQNYTGSTNVTFPTSGTLATTSNRLDNFAATTSAQLASVITDETGTGLLVFNNSPALVTPSLGVATATSINGLGVTATSAAALNIQTGRTLTVSGTATISTTPITRVNSVVFSSSGTYTPTTGTVYALVEMVAGGGGGGGVATAGASGNSSAAGGGGAGTYARRLFTSAQIGATATVTIGALGAGAIAGGNNGSSGSATSIVLTGTGTITMSAPGGQGGAGGANGTSSTAGGSGGGAATNADMATNGAPGSRGTSISSATFGEGGAGASTVWGGGGTPTGTVNGAIAGVNATGFGSGGSGASGAQAGTTNQTGGNGAPGLLLITEFIAV